jgi:hypothetical protein
MLEHWNKVHLMGVLSASLGLTSYLEITTTMTGGRYGEARELSFKPCLRLVYRMDAAPTRDAFPVDFAAGGEDIAEALAEIERRGLRFDLILVDAHHTPDCATRDLAAAWSLLNPEGVIVVHDCNPPIREIATPAHREGAWCGVTYKTFIDFCFGNAGVTYLTVDADFGCGVIIKPRTEIQKIENRRRAQRQEELKAQWAAAGSDFDAAFTLFDANRKALLRLTDFGGLRNELAAINGLAIQTL